MGPSPSPTLTPPIVSVHDDVFGTAVTILSFVLIVLPIIGIIGTAFLWRVYRSDKARPRSWVLFLMASGSTLVSVASVVIAYIAVRRFLGAGPFPEALLLLAGSVLLLEAIPIWYSMTIYRVRRKAMKQPD